MTGSQRGRYHARRWRAVFDESANVSTRQRAETTPFRVVTAVILAVAVGLVLAVGRVEAQTEPSVPELIVPGDTTATTAPAVTGGGADLAPADTSGPADELAPAASTDDGLAASTKVWIIIGALVAIVGHGQGNVAKTT